MTLPLDAARGSGEVAALSTLMLGVGYSLAAVAPFALGALRDATGGFTVPLTVLTLNGVILFTVALAAPIRTGATRASRSIGTAAPPG
jgi:CP family cyanate transporter-like MFS transporter